LYAQNAIPLAVHLIHLIFLSWLWLALWLGIRLHGKSWGYDDAKLSLVNFSTLITSSPH